MGYVCVYKTQSSQTALMCGKSQFVRNKSIKSIGGSGQRQTCAEKLTPPAIEKSGLGSRNFFLLLRTEDEGRVCGIIKQCPFCLGHVIHTRTCSRDCSSANWFIGASIHDVRKVIGFLDTPPRAPPPLSTFGTDLYSKSRSLSYFLCFSVIPLPLE